MAYGLLKSLLDPLILVLILMVVGIVLSYRNGKKPTARRFFISSFFILYITGISPVSNGLCYLLEKDYLFREPDLSVGQLDIVVVLGGGISENKYVRETKPSQQTVNRLLYAIQVFRTSGTKYLVCSGKGSGKLSEAAVMKRTAERLGIPAVRIKVEPRSRNTWEHAQEFNEMFSDKKMRVGLVTSAYHMKRSERAFRKYFPNVVSLPSDYLYSSSPLSIRTLLPSSGGLYNFFVVSQEMIGIAWYRIKAI